jgi:hypothetical protein
MYAYFDNVANWTCTDSFVNTTDEADNSLLPPQNATDKIPNSARRRRSDASFLSGIDERKLEQRGTNRVNYVIKRNEWDSKIIVDIAYDHLQYVRIKQVALLKFIMDMCPAATVDDVLDVRRQRRRAGGPVAGRVGGDVR